MIHGGGSVVQQPTYSSSSITKYYFTAVAAAALRFADGARHKNGGAKNTTRGILCIYGTYEEVFMYNIRRATIARDGMNPSLVGEGVAPCPPAYMHPVCTLSALLTDGCLSFESKFRIFRQQTLYNSPTLLK